MNDTQHWKRSLAAFALLLTANAEPATVSAKDGAGASSSGESAKTLNGYGYLSASGANQDALSSAAPSNNNAEMNAVFRRRYGLDPLTGQPGKVQQTAASSAQPNRLTETEAFRRRYGLPAPPQGAGSPQVAELEGRLRQMVLPEVQMDGLPLSEVLKYLSEESRKLDPEKKGLNFLINPNQPAIGKETIDPTTGMPFISTASEPVDLSSTLIRFNLPLRNVSMKDVLDAIVQVADRPIKYSVENYAVVFSFQPEAALGQMTWPQQPIEPLTVRTFRMDTNTFLPGLESAFGIKAELAEAKNANDRSKKMQSALKELLSQLGIALDNHKAVFYNELTGVVMVRATLVDLETVRAAIETLGGAEVSSSSTAAAAGAIQVGRQ